MQKVMFFDMLFQPIEQPDFKTCTEEDFWQLIYNADYIFIDGKDALEEFKKVVKKFVRDHRDSLYGIDETGAYGYFINGKDRWVKVMNVIRELESLKQNVTAAYIHNTRLPFEGDNNEER